MENNEMVTISKLKLFEVMVVSFRLAEAFYIDIGQPVLSIKEIEQELSGLMKRYEIDDNYCLTSKSDAI